MHLIEYRVKRTRQMLTSTSVLVWSPKNTHRQRPSIFFCLKIPIRCAAELQIKYIYTYRSHYLLNMTVRLKRTDLEFYQ